MMISAAKPKFQISAQSITIANITANGDVGRWSAVIVRISVIIPDRMSRIMTSSNIKYILSLILLLYKFLDS